MSAFNFVKVIVLTGILWSLPFCTNAQNEHYSFIRINTGDGLVNNQTTSIFKDSRGFLWFGTSSGLSRFDGTGFKNYSHNDRDSTSIMDNYIVNIQEDGESNLWVKMRWDYAIYDFDKEIFIPLSQAQKQMGINEVIETVYIDKDKRIWFKIPGQQHYKLYSPGQKKLEDPFKNRTFNSSPVADFYHDGLYYYYVYTSGMIECFDSNYRLVYRDNQLENKLGQDSLNTLLFVDNDHDLWLYGNNDGIHYFSIQNKKWHHYTKDSDEITLSTNLINAIAQDTYGKIWIGTDHGGIDIINKQSSLSTLYQQPQNSKSISQNSITDLFVDDMGIVWISTYKNGICYYHPSIHKFPHFRNVFSDNKSLPFNDVNCFAEDDSGNLWIGTNGGGLLYYNRKTEQYTTYTHDPNNKNSLSNDVIVSVFIDDEGLLWIGTFTGGLNTFDGRHFTRYMTNRNKAGLPNNNIWTITQDDLHRIWIGTLGNGIVLFDKKSGDFEPLPNVGDTYLPSQFTSHIVKMNNGDMFIGTAGGILFYSIKNKQFQNHPYQMDHAILPISNNNVNAVLEDSRGLFWVATREGLTVIDAGNDRIKKFHKEDGLPEDIMNCIREDNEGAIWVSKSTGLSQIKVQPNVNGKEYTYTIANFTQQDGLQGEEFNVNASLKTKAGELIFGGPNGFNLFMPEKIEFNTNLPDLVFTDFQIFNRSIHVGEKVGKRVILNKSITSTNQITLKHSMNVFSIEFAALNYFISEKVQYQYMLDGFDKDWITSDDHIRKVTYTNLNPGDYIFKVKASNNDGLWNDDYNQLKLKILPPFYKTPLAYLLYAVFIICLLLYYRHSMLKRQRGKFELEQERLQTRRHLELDEMKLRFLTNVSHEFRTPLTLILSPLERLLQQNKDGSQRNLLEIIERNSNQLLGLVNQLLDFRKLDLHGLRYTPSYGDIIAYLRYVCEGFSEGFRKKNISFEFQTTIQSHQFQFDHDKIQKVMMNLLSNAMKFTSEGGWVSVRVSTENLKTSGQSNIIIGVKDTGIGILEDESEKIFERFYQSRNIQSLNLSGSGIGLNLVKEMVQLHNGTISVESKPGMGSEFIIRLPLENAEVEYTLSEDLPYEFEDEETTTEKLTSDKPSVLLVEDHSDFRTFMKETLQDRYTVYESTNGEEGFGLVHKKHPDLIISDVMMPGLDGLALCRKLKGDVRTSHIPVILLTARTADEDKIKGLEIGADDYITKPFKMDLLLTRLHNLMERRKNFHERFQQKMEITPTDIEISSLDEKLIKKAIELVEQNIAETGFSVEDLSHELGMSRVYLYKKLTAITGKSPLEFIRIIRLKRGAQLLEKSQLTIAEVAYEVGFNSPRYFSKYFEEEFGILPSKYIKKFGQKHKEKIK